MKKFLLACVCGLMAWPGIAALQQECPYTPRQTLIRNARNADEINALIQQGMIFEDPDIRCGGSLMQLAILRGNVDVLQALLQQDIKRVEQKVTADSYNIPGAPKQIPLILFAAYSAPNPQIMDLMIRAAELTGYNLAVTDEKGQNILWYLDKNPVLRNTEISDALTQKMLTSMVGTKNAGLNGSALTGGMMPASLTPQQGLAIQSGEALRPTGAVAQAQFAQQIAQEKEAESNKIVEPVSKLK